MSKSRLLILGAGGHGKVVAETAFLSNQFSKISFLDDQINGADFLPSHLNSSIIGSFSDCHLPEIRHEFSSAIVAIGDPASRLLWSSLLVEAGYALPALIHPSAIISPSAQLDNGVVVFAHVVVQASCSIGFGAILNTGCSVDHDSDIADGVHLCPGSRLAGEVKVGERSWIGIGASVIQQVRIGSDVTVGAGAAVVRDIPNKVTVVGVPARVVSSR